MLLRQSFLYLLANVLAALVGFLAVVVLTRLVTPAEYGVYVLAMSLGTVLSTCLFTWQRHAILRFQAERDADVRLSLLVGYLLTLVLHPLALLLLVKVFSIPLEKAAAAVLLAAAGSFFELGQEILRARQRVGAYVRGGIVRSATSFLLCLLAVKLDAGGLGLVAAVVCGYVLSAMMGARAIWDGPRLPARLGVLRQLAGYGLPITLSGVFVALTLALDRFVVYTLLGTEAVGLYGATADFVRQCAILPALSASLAIAPLAVANLDRDDNGEATSHNLADGAELLIAALMPTVIGLSIAAPQVAGTVLGLEYRAAAVSLIPLIAFAFFAHSISQQYVQLSFGLARKPHFFIGHTGSIFFINAALILPLVKVFGATGAALSLLISECVGVLLGLWLARRAYPLPLNGRRISRILVAAAVMAGACGLAQVFVDRTDIIGLVIMIGVGVISYGCVAVALDVANVRTIATAALARRRVRATPARRAP